MSMSTDLKALLIPCVMLTTLMSYTEVEATPCNTGVTGIASTCGTVLLVTSSVDSHWTVAGPITPTFPVIAIPPTIFGPAYANYNPAWLANGPDSGWITPSALLQEEPSGQYVYHTTFMDTALFGGRYSSDNELLEVFLNNSLLLGFPVNAGNAFDSWTTFSIAGGQPGLNSLDFVVRNRDSSAPVTATTTGFRAEFSAIPEPSTLALYLVGLGSSILLRSRRAKPA